MRRTTAQVTPAHLLLGLTLVLTVLGTLFVFEASVAESFATFNNQYYLLQQHIIGLAIGLVAFVVAIKTPTEFWQKTSPLWFGLSLILLLIVLIPGIGLELNGARRWISLFGIRLQPVEFLKLAIVLYFPLWLAKHQRLGPFITITAIPVFFLLLQPDLGSALIVIGLAFALYFVSGGDLKKIGIIAAVGLPLLALIIFTSPYRMQRVLTFLNPESDPLGASFHVRQNTLALGRGGLLGQGFGNSSQKFSYVPEASTDSVFAIIAEEVGLLGSLVILGLFGAYFYLIYTIARKQTLIEHQLLLFGILAWIGLQTLLNLGAVVALVPLTGAPLPFFSYGRSSQVMILFATGIVIRRGFSK
jgi:cell division protein FtsW